MAAPKTERPCWVLVGESKGDPPSVTEIKNVLETGSTAKKIEYMKKTITLLLSGEPMPQILMTVIRYVQPDKDHTLKKLCTMFFEIVEKHGPDGKPIDVLIMACNAWMYDLNHPNEYVRGNALRFLCKVKEPDLLEPLIPSVRTCLEHRHAYVRRNAVLTVFAIYRSFDFLIPDAPEIIFNFLEGEADTGCKRNAFLMLCNCAQDLAVKFLVTVVESVGSFDDVLQLAVVELIRKVYRTNPQERSQYIACIITCLESSSPAVQYEAANTLIVLSASATAIRAAATTYINLVVGQSDNNVKLIVLDRLVALKEHHPRVLQDLLMDLMRALASPNMDLRERVLTLALDLVSPRNIDEVILVLKKEVNRSDGEEKDAAYRQLLIKTIHSCAVKFPSVASSVVDLLMDFLSDSNATSAGDVAIFVREVTQKYTDLRPAIVKKLVLLFPTIHSSKVFRALLWILGEYAVTTDEIRSTYKVIKDCVGEFPFVIEKDEDEEGEEGGKAEESKGSASTGARKLNSDGTYATQTAASLEAASKGTVADVLKDNTPFPLRALLWQGDFFLGTTLAMTLAKLAHKLGKLIPPAKRNMVYAEMMLILTSILRLGASSIPPQPIDKDSRARIMQCLRMIAKPSTFSTKLFLEDSGRAFAALLEDQAAHANDSRVKEKRVVKVQADDVISVRQLRSKNDSSMPFEDEDEAALVAATGQSADNEASLNRVFQLTGFSDPLYAEASVVVHQYDISLDILVINQTSDTVQNVNVELNTLGDLKLVERPTPFTLGPGAAKSIHASVKVSSTETGIIFGSIVYDVAGAASGRPSVVVLSEIMIDIMDYIQPATCDEGTFRSMWSEFEWENKVAINTAFGDVSAFLDFIVAATNMQCLTPLGALQGESKFLAANLYAKSIFGEDALANVSVQEENGAISGHIRIRSKTQGIALSLGDKITLDLKGGSGGPNRAPAQAD